MHEIAFELVCGVDFNLGCTGSLPEPQVDLANNKSLYMYAGGFHTILQLPGRLII